MKPRLIGITGKARAGKDSFYGMVLAPRGYTRIALADPLKGLALVLEGLTVPMVTPGLAEQVAAYTKKVAKDEGRAPEPREIVGIYLKPTLSMVLERYYAYFGANKAPRERRLLQHLGTEIGRSIDPGLWLVPALTEARRVLAAGGRVAVTDVRFPNEAYAIQGDVERMRAYYEQHDGPTLDVVRHALTHTWDEEGGLLPPPGLGEVVRVVRDNAPEVLDPEAQKHASERMVDAVEPDHTVRAASLVELKAAGDELFGPVEDYLAGA
ncbi:hypothetical protein [Oceanithermus sp.]|uniref:hypothetical protein n=1 Tax=Oceanithermus sp. TaxID=2268145 RepID=UPI00257CA517|nr:hypothetical protein [Oceanithermus sp.]